MSALALRALPYIVGILLVAGVYFGWASHEKALGAAQIEASNMAEIAMQNQKDAATNKKIAVQVQAQKTQVEAKAQAAGVKIDTDPVEPGSQADIDAAAAVNCMIDEATCPK